MIKVMLADDEDLVRSGLRMILSSAGDMEVVAECDDGHLVADLARRHRPHVVLLDIRMRSSDGLMALRRLRAIPDPPKIAMLTTFDVDEYLFGALAAGAGGFLLKDSDPALLLDAVRGLHEGRGLIDPRVAGRLIARFAQLSPRPAPRRVDQEALMANRTYNITEIVGTSPDGVDAAINNAIGEASQTLRNLDWFEVQSIRGHVDGDAVADWQVTIKLGFRHDA